jgi:hypothetical protein
MKLGEIHDHPRFPTFLRDLVTDALESLWIFSNTYRSILPRLLNALDQAGTREVLDLCSGGGGPWAGLVKESQGDEGFNIGICLSDKYPNRVAFERAHTTEHRIGFEPRSIDAMRVPDDLGGFRTIFFSFHHFDPDEARRVLGNAVESKQGIGIFEAARRAPRTMLTICCIPMMALLLAPSIRPFRWSRLFWTYLLPVVPFVYSGTTGSFPVSAPILVRNCMRLCEIWRLMITNGTWERSNPAGCQLPIWLAALRTERPTVRWWYRRGGPHTELATSGRE